MFTGFKADSLQSVVSSGAGDMIRSSAMCAGAVPGMGVSGGVAAHDAGFSASLPNLGQAGQLQLS